MRIFKTLLLSGVAVILIAVNFAVGEERATAPQDCPKEKKKVCIEETVAGHTVKHPAYTNECLAAKFGAKVLNDGDCPH